VSERVLVVRPDNAGDVLLAGPAVRAAAGRSAVTLWCGPNGRDAAALLPGVSSVIEAAVPWIAPDPEPIDPKETMELIRTIRTEGFDAAVVLTSFHQSPLPTALLLRLAEVPFIGAISEDYPGSLLDVRHRVSDDVHEVTRALSLMAACGFPLPDDDDGRLVINRVAASPLPRDYLGYVVVHPGASAPARSWPPEKSRALVAALARSGRRVVVTGSPAEQMLTSFVVGRPDGDVINAGGTTDLGQLAAIIANADAIVVGNTGPAHIAAAVGTPVVSIYAPTVPPVRWKPWRVRHVVLGEQTIPCAGCRARACPIEGHPCISSITVADVVNALGDVIAAHAAGREVGVAP
jgi:ADP-heptose:LPS heptosyltransferase